MATKSLAFSFVAAALTSTVPAGAATTIISRDAPSSPSDVVNYILNPRPLVAGWSSTQNFENVLITAQLTGTSVTAYLVTELDWDYATDHVATVTVTPASTAPSQYAPVTLFSGLSLPASDYYLILQGPGTWAASSFENAVRDSSVSNLGSYIGYPPVGNPPSGGEFSYQLQYYLFSVTSVPEPGMPLLLTGGVLFFAVRRRTRY